MSRQGEINQGEANTGKKNPNGNKVNAKGSSQKKVKNGQTKNHPPDIQTKMDMQPLSLDDHSASLNRRMRRANSTYSSIKPPSGIMTLLSNFAGKLFQSDSKLKTPSPSDQITENKIEKENPPKIRARASSVDSTSPQQLGKNYYNPSINSVKLEVFYSDDEYKEMEEYFKEVWRETTRASSVTRRVMKQLKDGTVEFKSTIKFPDTQAEYLAEKAAWEKTHPEKSVLFIYESFVSPPVWKGFVAVPEQDKIYEIGSIEPESIFGMALKDIHNKDLAASPLNKEKLRELLKSYPLRVGHPSVLDEVAEAIEVMAISKSTAELRKEKLSDIMQKDAVHDASEIYHTGRFEELELMINKNVANFFIHENDRTHENERTADAHQVKKFLEKKYDQNYELLTRNDLRKIAAWKQRADRGDVLFVFCNENSQLQIYLMGKELQLKIIDNIHGRRIRNIGDVNNNIQYLLNLIVLGKFFVANDRDILFAEKDKKEDDEDPDAEDWTCCKSVGARILDCCDKFIELLPQIANSNLRRASLFGGLSLRSREASVVDKSLKEQNQFFVPTGSSLGL